MHMSDLVIQGLASNLFWLIIFVTAAALFRNEVRNILNALGSFKVAGASFELKDSRSTIQSYVVLTNIMVETLSDRDSAIKLGDLLSDVSVRQLARFAITYAKDVPEDIKQVELVKNIAAVITRRGDTESAKAFYDALLKENPRDVDVLNLKALTLVDGDQADLFEALQMQDNLVQRRPTSLSYRFNRSLTRAKLGRLEEALEDLSILVDKGYWRRRADLLDLPEFAVLQSDDRFKALNSKLAQMTSS